VHTPCRSNPLHVTFAEVLTAPATLWAMGVSAGLHAAGFGLLAWGGWSAGTTLPEPPTSDVAVGLRVVLELDSQAMMPALPPFPKAAQPEPSPIPAQPPAALTISEAKPKDTKPVTEVESAADKRKPDPAAHAEPRPEPAALPAASFNVVSAPKRDGLRPWQPPSGETAADAPGAAVSFAGLSSQGEVATTVVYAVDVSGPMVTAMPLVEIELIRSIHGLSPGQRFNIVAFSDLAGEPAVRQFSPQMVASSREELYRMRAWFRGLSVGGASNPIDGLKKALQVAGEAQDQAAKGAATTPGRAVVFLLCRSINRTSGNDSRLDAARDLAELDRLNPLDTRSGKRRAVIKTIQFIEPDPTGVLEQIAIEHGGAGKAPNNRVITPAELGRR
jgi:hypothetical protein